MSLADLRRRYERARALKDSCLSLSHFIGELRPGRGGVFIGKERLAPPQTLFPDDGRVVLTDEEATRLREIFQAIHTRLYKDLEAVS